MLAIVLALLFLSDPSARLPEKLRQEESARVDLIRRISPSVVAIFDPTGKGGGTGVVVTKSGYVVTNYHVTETNLFLKCGLPDGRMYDAALTGIDPVGDVAMIKLVGRDDFPAATLGDSDKLRLGDVVFAIGNPFLLAADFQPTVTQGIVSGLHRYQYPSGTLLEYSDCIQTDASINPGNSGGPLFNANGDVVGIIGRGSFEKRGRVNVGVGYAISINQVRNFLDHLRGGLIVDHASLGATVTLDPDGRVLIDEILANSDAYRRGLRPNDEIVTFGGRPIGSVNQFKNVLGIFPKGWSVDLVYRRNERKTNLSVQLLGLHHAEELIEMLSNKKPPGNPDDPKKPKEPQPKPEEEPELDLEKKADIPASLQGLCEKKTGFANFAFNRLLRERLLTQFRQTSEFADRKGKWVLILKPEQGDEVKLSLTDDIAGWEQGNDVFALRAGDADNLDPPATGGLLTTLFQWRGLLIRQDRAFGRCDYLGGFLNPSPQKDTAEPASADEFAALTGPRWLALSTARDGIEANWFFDPVTGFLCRIEASVEESEDPCRIDLDDYRKAGDRLLPHRWTVSRGGLVVGVFRLQSAELAP